MKRTLKSLKVFKNIAYWTIFGVVVGYSLWTMVRAIHKSYLMNEEIKRMQKQVAQLKIANENLKNLIVYYQTNTFKELEARSRLNLKKSGERVYIIPDHQKEHPQISITPPNVELVRSSNEQSKPNYVKWWLYIWDGKVD